MSGVLPFYERQGYEVVGQTPGYPPGSSTHHLRKWLALTLLALTAGAASGCGDASYRGSWEVVGYERPAVSIIGDLEAQHALGVTFELSKDSAAVGGLGCPIGELRRQTLSVRSVEMAYDLARGELGLPQETVEMVDVTCTEGELDFGQQLIRIAPDSLLTPWRGIFLVLAKR
jgi:hypothetical protein